MSGDSPMMVEYQILDKLIAIEKKLDNGDIKNWLDINRAVEYSSLSETVIGRLIKQGRLKVSTATGKRLFKKVWLDTFLEGK